MARANRLGMFADVRSILDQALTSGGGTFQCATHGAAVHWRQRANQFRKLYAESLGPKGVSEYDVLVFPRIVEGTATVVIKMRVQAGTFIPANDAAPTTNDELLDEALALARKIGGE